MFQPRQGISPGQNKKLWVSAKHLGLGDAELHQLVAEITGKGSIRELTSEEAARVIDRLVEMGGENPPRPRPGRQRPEPLPPNVIELATQSQIDMIARLLWHLGWGTEDEYFRACVRRSIGRENIRTKAEASNVINMLRAKLKELGLDDQVARSHQRPGPGFSGCGGVQGGRSA